MVNVLEAIAEFPKTLEHYSESASNKEVERVAADIGRVRNLNPPVYNEKSIGEFLRGRAAHLKTLVNDYFVKSMANQFPLISDELFALKRHLTLVAGEKGKYTVVRDDTDEAKEKPQGKNQSPEIRVIDVPLFAYVPLFEGEHKAKLGGFTKSKYHSYSGYTERTTVNIEARLPGSIGPNLKDAYRHAMQHYFSTLADMFTNPVAADIMYSEGQFVKPEIGAIWIPTPESLNLEVTEKLIMRRKDLDPAMVISARGKKYLVKTWRVDDEEPFEHYIREFTTGDLKGKLG